jgi:hypothetical protein
MVVAELPQLRLFLLAELRLEEWLELLANLLTLVLCFSLDSLLPHPIGPSTA